MLQKSSFDSHKHARIVENYQFDTFECVRKSLLNGSNRYLMLFFDSEVTKVIFRSEIEKHTQSGAIESEGTCTTSQLEAGSPSQMSYILGSSLFFDRRSKDYSVKILSKIKHYSSQASLLILDNLDLIYGALYDLFNQRFAQDSENRYCNIVYEDFKESLSIDANFRCIVFKNQSDFDIDRKFIEEKLPSPLMNRFEKHLFGLPDFWAGDLRDSQDKRSGLFLPDPRLLSDTRHFLDRIKSEAGSKFSAQIRANIDSLFVEDIVFLANTNSFFINLFVKLKSGRRAW